MLAVSVVRSTITGMQFETLALVLQAGHMYEAVSDYYSDWAYHNLDHAANTMIKALDFADECEANGVYVNRFVLVASALYHDANYHEPLDTNTYETKEECSAAIATHDLTILGVDAATVEHVADCIRSTARGVSCKTIEAKILRKADLANLAGPFGEMIINSYNLFQEICAESGMSKGFLEFLGTVRLNIQEYLDEDISLGDFDRLDTGRSLWLSSTERNLTILQSVLSLPTRVAEPLINKVVTLAEKRGY